MTDNYINKIINADCLDIMKQLPDKCIDMTLTDFPYDAVNRKTNGINGDYMTLGCEDFLEFAPEDYLSEIIRLTKGSIYCFCGYEQLSSLINLMNKNNASTRVIVYEKTNPVPRNPKTIWLAGIELCAFGRFANATFNGNCLNTVLRYPICCDDFRFHKTQKPLKLFSELIKISSNENDLILDCFSGSGTIAIACHNLKRRFICIEKDKEYWQKSVERLEIAQAQMRLF